MKKSINRDQAILILNNMLSNKSLIIHSYSVALVMEYYGKKLNENKEIYYITGLLHDADYEKYPNDHPKIIVNKLKEIAKDLDKIDWVKFFNITIQSNNKNMKEMQKKLNNLSKKTNDIKLKKIINTYNKL